jgi:hypothetical protein
MTSNLTIDGRLAPALRDVAAHGITVRRAMDDPTSGTHAAMIRAELTSRFPAGMCSYVLWATAGDAYALHCSDADTATAVAGACDAAGISTTRAGTVLTARVDTARPAAPAADTSPWRWLETRRAA